RDGAVRQMGGVNRDQDPPVHLSKPPWTAPCLARHRPRALVSDCGSGRRLPRPGRLTRRGALVPVAGGPMVGLESGSAVGGLAPMSSKERLRVMLVDDHEVVRSGIK